MNKISMWFYGLSLAIGAFALSATSIFAQTPTATSTMDTIMSSIINTVVELVVKVFSQYWPYVLIFGIIAGLVGVFARFAHLGSKR